ncbi:MAG TPA: hypothetical protein VK955_01010, partial [Xanthobacteraceae bacterium]|nr:hypothetical protein [Xanthobacteraceae bacterium]
MLDRVVIGARSANIDVNAGRLPKSRIWSGQRNHRHGTVPRRSRRAVGRNPNCAIRFAAFHQTFGIEPPRIMFGKASTKARAHGKAGHP